MRCRMKFFFKGLLITMSTFAVLLLPTFISEAQPFSALTTSGSPVTPFSKNLLKYYLLFLIHQDGGDGEGQYGRDGNHEPENMLALNCHHPAVGRGEPEKLATNTHTQTHSRHTPQRSRGLCEQPRGSYLGCLGSLCSAPPSAPSPLFLPPLGSSGAAAGAVAG